MCVFGRENEGLEGLEGLREIERSRELKGLRNLGNLLERLRRLGELKSSRNVVTLESHTSAGMLHVSMTAMDTICWNHAFILPAHNFTHTLPRSPKSTFSLFRAFHTVIQDDLQRPGHAAAPCAAHGRTLLDPMRYSPFGVSSTSTTVVGALAHELCAEVADARGARRWHWGDGREIFCR